MSPSSKVCATLWINSPRSSMCVMSAVASDRQDRFAAASALIVDDVIGACLPRERGLGRRAHGGDDGRLALFRELNGIMPDRPCSRRNEHGRAFLDAGEADALIGSKG